jgi:hypothetical protein
MTSDEIKAAGYVYDSQTGQWFSPGHYRVKRANPQLQEQQDDHRQKPERETVAKAADDHKTGISEGDGADRPKYHVTITVRFSNRRRTDLSGKLDTLLDCLVHASRRLLGDDSADRDPRRTVRKGPGGRDDNDSATGIGEVPF